MAIVTLAREEGTLTAVQKQELNSSLGIGIIDKETLEKRFAEFGVDPRMFKTYDEKKPGVFSKLFQGRIDGYLEVLKTVVYQEAALNRRLIVGRGSYLILKDIPNCLRLRLVGSLPRRIERLCQEEGITPEAARRRLERSDRDRSSFCRFHFNQDWHDARLYHLTLSTDDLDWPTHIEIVRAALRQLSHPDIEERSRKLLFDRVLERQILWYLHREEGLSMRFLNVVSRAGHVRISGTVPSSVIAKRAIACVERVDGVVEVVNELRISAADISKRLP